VSNARAREQQTRVKPYNCEAVSVRRHQ